MNRPMNVIKVPRPQRRRNSAEIHPAKIEGRQQSSEFEWHGLAEVLLFGVISIISIWPIWAAMGAMNH